MALTNWQNANSVTTAQRPQNNEGYVPQRDGPSAGASLGGSIMDSIKNLNKERIANTNTRVQEGIDRSYTDQFRNMLQGNGPQGQGQSAPPAYNAQTAMDARADMDRRGYSTAQMGKLENLQHEQQVIGNQRAVDDLRQRALGGGITTEKMAELQALRDQGRDINEVGNFLGQGADGAGKVEGQIGALSKDGQSSNPLISDAANQFTESLYNSVKDLGAHATSQEINDHIEKTIPELTSQIKDDRAAAEVTTLLRQNVAEGRKKGIFETIADNFEEGGFAQTVPQQVSQLLQRHNFDIETARNDIRQNYSHAEAKAMLAGLDATNPQSNEVATSLASGSENALPYRGSNPETAEAILEATENMANPNNLARYSTTKAAYAAVDHTVTPKYPDTMSSVVPSGTLTDDVIQRVIMPLLGKTVNEPNKHLSNEFGKAGYSSNAFTQQEKNMITQPITEAELKELSGNWGEKGFANSKTLAGLIVKQRIHALEVRETEEAMKPLLRENRVLLNQQIKSVNELGWRLNIARQDGEMSADTLEKYQTELAQAEAELAETAEYSRSIKRRSEPGSTSQPFVAEEGQELTERQEEFNTQFAATNAKLDDIEKRYKHDDVIKQETEDRETQEKDAASREVRNRLVAGGVVPKEYAAMESIAKSFEK